ncbi:MAG TPA: hypothetical protein EYH06_01000 [Chromatiales bacterium]|nr:hypothetical protein [Thiotrichales bacterium]HIP67150.1 hypothetical protein [Chromatiales bacterium]
MSHVKQFSGLALFICVLQMANSETIENFLNIEFVRVPAGVSVMGTEDLEAAAMEMPEPDVNKLHDESPAHTVVFEQPFFLSKTEITQAQWLKVMENKPGPENNWQQKNWRDLPAVSISWFMAQRFAKELSKLDKHYNYRLPTEAEWEYAARAGSTDLRPWPLDDLEEHAWFINNSGDEPQPVATRKPNAFGLHDMIGNVWEWTADWYASDIYKQGRRINPKGPEKGNARVRRGGSYHCPLHLTRVGYRSADDPGKRYSVLGFRVVAEKK